MEIEREEGEEEMSDVPTDSDLEKEMREERLSDWEDIGGAPSTRDAMTERERVRDGDMDKVLRRLNEFGPRFMIWAARSRPRTALFNVDSRSGL